MKIITTILISILLLFSACNQEGTFKDEAISKDLKSEIEILNKKLIEGFKNEDYDKIKSVFSQKLIKRNGSGLERFVPEVSNYFDESKYVTKNQIYINDDLQKQKDQNIAISNGDLNRDFNIDFVPMNNEVFINIGYFEHNLKEVSFMTIYGNYEGEWKVNILKVGDYTYFKKDAYDWYLSAIENYKNGSLIDAANHIGLAKKCLSPGGQFFKYQKDAEIAEYYTKIMNEVNEKFTFPLIVNIVKSKPEIFKIFPKATDDGFYPMVMYSTSYKMLPENEDNIKKEGDLLHEKIGEIFNGLDKNKERILYMAFEKGVKAGDEIKEYSFVKKLN